MTEAIEVLTAVLGRLPPFMDFLPPPDTGYGTIDNTMECFRS